MMYNRFKHFMNHCKVFATRMNYYKVPEDMQLILLKSYITEYIINHNIKINLSQKHIKEFIA
jgi:hypothetical protein